MRLNRSDLRFQLFAYHGYSRDQLDKMKVNELRVVLSNVLKRGA